MDWRLVVKVLAVATQFVLIFWILSEFNQWAEGIAAVIFSVLLLSALVLVLNLAKSLRSADTELSTLKQELEKAELRLKLHRLNVQSREKT